MAPNRIVQALGDFATSFPDDLSFRPGQLLWVIRGSPSHRGPDWIRCYYKYSVKTNEHVPDRGNRQELLEGNVPKSYVTANPEVMYQAKVVTPFTGTESDDALTTAKGMLVDVVGELVDDSDWVIARTPDTDDFGLVFKPYIHPIEFSATVLYDANPSVESSTDLLARRGDECVLLDRNPHAFWPLARVVWSLNPSRISTKGTVPWTYLQIHQASTSDPEQLPRMRIPLETRRVVLHIPGPIDMTTIESTFARDIEDALAAATGSTGFKQLYDVEVFAAYDTQALDKAAAGVWKFIQAMVLDMAGTAKTHIILLGVDVGGIIAVETVRTWRKLLNMPSLVPAAQRLVFEGVICINSPFFLLHPHLFGAVDRATLGTFATMFALPSKAHKHPALAGMMSKWEKRASGILSKTASSKSVHAVNAGMEYMAAKLARDFETLGLASPASSAAAGAAGSVSATALLLPFTPSDDATSSPARIHRRSLLSSSIASESLDAQLLRLRDLGEIPTTILVTRVTSPEAPAPTYIHLPPQDQFPEEIQQRLVYFDGSSPMTMPAYQLAAESTDQSRQPGVCGQLVDYVAVLVDYWADAREMMVADVEE